MLQDDRNKLFNLAYGLDNRTRLWIPKRVMPFREVSHERLDQLRMQGKEDTVYVVLTGREFDELADQLRDFAANDEREILTPRKRRL